MPVEKIAHILGKKWSIEIISEMAKGEFEGFNAFLRKEGATSHMLAAELKELEDEGIVEKKTRVEGKITITDYSLTKKGIELYDIITALGKWDARWGKKKQVSI